MGLLSGLFRAVDPYFPDEQIRGLLGSFGRGVDPNSYNGPSPGFQPGQAQDGAAPPILPKGIATAPRRPGVAKIGALLGDMGTSLQGGQGTALANLRAQDAARAQAAAIQGIYGRLAGGAAPGGSPGEQGSARPMTIREAAPIIAQLQAAGYKTEDIISLLDKAGPDVQFVNGVGVDKRDLGAVGQRVGVNLQNVNGTMVDTQDSGNANRFVPEVEKGQRLVYDEHGQPIGVMDLGGYTQSLGNRAAATARGTAQGQAPYEFVTVQGPDGQPITIAKDKAAGGVFTGQSPAQGEVAKAGAAAQVALPQVIANAEQTLSVINGLRKSPSLPMRTGVWGVAPAIPGTEGANFDAAEAQLKGKLFLEAYNTLKGGGQITEVEGKKATDAMARLNRTQTPEAYKAALDDLHDVIEAGIGRAKAQAALGPSGGGAPSALPSLSDIDAAIARKKGRR